MGAEKGVAFCGGTRIDALFLTGDKRIVTTDGFAEKYGLTVKNRGIQPRLTLFRVCPAPFRMYFRQADKSYAKNWLPKAISSSLWSLPQPFFWYGLPLPRAEGKTVVIRRGGKP